MNLTQPQNDHRYTEVLTYSFKQEFVDVTSTGQPKTAIITIEIVRSGESASCVVKGGESGYIICCNHCSCCCCFNGCIISG